MDVSITDDYQCARDIHDTHKRLYGNGFSAWFVHEGYCANGKSTAIIEGCFDDIAITHHLFKPTSFPDRTTFNDNQVDNNQITDSHANGAKQKVYERCELARELRYKHNVPLEQIHTWVCIVQRESNFDTSAIGRLNADGSLDHGLFQISDIYWCLNDGIGKGCNAACTDFENTDITDDVKCITKIYEEHQRLVILDHSNNLEFNFSYTINIYFCHFLNTYFSFYLKKKSSLFGNGFHAWTTYAPFCAQTTSSHTDDCFSNVPQQKVEITTKKTFPTFVPFTRPTETATTTTTVPKTTATTRAAVVTKRPKSTPISASTSTPFKPFKFTTFKPFSFFTSNPKSSPSTSKTTTTTTTTELPTATVQFINSYTTATTRQPVFSKAQRTIPTKLAFTPTYKPFEFTTPRASALIGTTKTKKHSYAIYNNNYFTMKTTTERSTAATTKPHKQFTTKFNTATNATTFGPKITTLPTKFNLFDLYLGRVSTKPPQRYVIPSFPPLPAHPIGHLSPYTRFTTQAPPFSNTYSIPDMLTSKAAAIRFTSTKKPSAEQVQQLFQSKVTSIGQSLGIQNSTYASLDSFITSPRGRVYRYSFSGTTKKNTVNTLN